LLGRSERLWQCMVGSSGFTEAGRRACWTAGLKYILEFLR
jgi:hypothetical protein